MLTRGERYLSGRRSTKCGIVEQGSSINLEENIVVILLDEGVDDTARGGVVDLADVTPARLIVGLDRMQPSERGIDNRARCDGIASGESIARFRTTRVGKVHGGSGHDSYGPCAEGGVAGGDHRTTGSAIEPGPARVGTIPGEHQRPISVLLDGARAAHRTHDVKTLVRAITGLADVLNLCPENPGIARVDRDRPGKREIAIDLARFDTRIVTHDRGVLPAVVVAVPRSVQGVRLHIHGDRRINPRGAFDGENLIGNDRSGGVIDVGVDEVGLSTSLCG